MSETAHILRHASARSLIVLDEVGRGTSTYDGISLAWAIAEEIHNFAGAKTLFATHYHELTQLAALPAAAGEHAPNAFRNYTMAVKERGSEVVFLRQVVPGGAEKSFGIHVARLAGLDGRIIARANDVLVSLEAERGTVDSGRQPEGRASQILDGRSPPADADAMADDGSTETQASGVSRVAEPVAEYHAGADEWRLLLGELMQIDVANLTPVQALNWLNDMQLRVMQMLVR